jgi:hypothetical protein
MVTKLESPLKRALSIDGRPYVLTITPTGFLLVEKGRRKGYEMDWMSFVSGDAALATALNASIAQAPAVRKSFESRGQAAAPPSPSRKKRSA